MPRSRRLFRAIAPLSVAVGLVACDQTEPRGPGAIRVTASATSQEGIGFEYGIAIDSGTPWKGYVGIPLQFLQTGMAHGEHQITVSGTPAVCTGKEPRTVTLEGDDTAKVVVAIVCPRTTGDLQVNVSTTGADLDPNGYFVRVDGLTRGFTTPNGSTTILYLAVGTHSISLSDVAPNCTLTNAPNFTITAGAITTVNLTVTCTAVAVLRFVASASGVERDPDGYSIQVDGQVLATVLQSQSVNVRVSPGSRAWVVGDIQPNCPMDGATSGTPTLAANDTVTINLTTTCTAIPMGSVGTAVSDPASDTLAFPNSGNAPHDILGVTARYATNWLILVVRFSKPVTSTSTFDPKALYGFIELDADESTSTGLTPFSNSFGATATLGVDAYLSLSSMDSVSTALLPRSSSGPAPLGKVRTRFEGDSVIFQIPLKKLGASEDGNLAMVMTLGTQDRPTDIAPNTGAILARLPAGAGVAPSAASTQSAPAVVAPPLVRRAGQPWWAMGTAAAARP